MMLQFLLIVISKVKDFTNFIAQRLERYDTHDLLHSQLEDVSDRCKHQKICASL